MIVAALTRVGTYFYVFPTFSSGRRILWDAINNDGFKILDYIPQELVESKNEQQMRLRLINGSVIQIIGSDNYDNSLVGTNPVGMIFSEYALQDENAYNFSRPILTANDGWALFLSCVSPETLVITKNGLKRIHKISPLREEYNDLNQDIYGINGFNNAEQFYYGGMQQTLKITLSSGYEIECTPIHPLWDGNEWIKAQDLKVGKLLPIQYGQDVFGNGLDMSDFKYSDHGLRKDIIEQNDDFFYLLGLIHADGNYNKNKVCITNKKDLEIIEFVNSLGFKTRSDGIHHELSSRTFCELLEFLGFKHGARLKTFPEKLFECNKKQLKSFIQGLFDGDGCSSSHISKRGCVKFTTTCKEFIKDLQVILLNFGIVSSIRNEDKAPTKLVNAWSRIYNLEITGYFAHIFYRDIGFRLERKQKNHANIPIGCREESGNIYPIDSTKIPKLKKSEVTNNNFISRRLIKKLNKKYNSEYFNKLLQDKFFYSPIAKIEFSENYVYDFVIPVTNSFFSNGFISHNTPRGKNHFYELYKIALDNPDRWFCSKLTIDDTNHIPTDSLEEERKEMSEDLIQQEYFTSFTMGVEGAYYTKYIDRMRLNNQIGDVNWEPAFKVHTAWDIGVRDSTVIIFFQQIGQTIRIIDFYEKNKEGLEHYIKIVKDKPYTYGKHIAPHDIQVREFSSGMSRIDKARDLGINFTVARNISIMDGIEAVRSTLSKIYIDQTRCKNLIKAIENYRQEFDSKKKVYKANPLHNEFSHAADCLRYLCISLPRTSDGMSEKDIERIKGEALYGTKGNLPDFFR